jgi:lysine 6-dehydrogenase
MKILVLGTGIVGSAATWDLVRRGHDVTVADKDGATANRVGSQFGATPYELDVSDRPAVASLLWVFDVVINAVSYVFGRDVADAAIDTHTHYLDFGGNPKVVSAQKDLHGRAREAGIMIIPDCGLAPGLANVLGEDLISSASSGPIESIHMRVGALPQQPSGELGYQLAFSAGGLINEYAELCEVIEQGAYATVEPLTRFEDVVWDGWGPLEAFSTAGGTSTMCSNHVGRVRDLEYKTLRYPGHGHTFRAMLELGMFESTPRTVDGVSVSPRSVLIDSLNRCLPSGQPDLVLVRAWRDDDGSRSGYQLEDVAKGGFSALARTTAFPATALAHLIATDQVNRPGVFTMNEAVLASELLPELVSVGIEVKPL